MTVRDLIEILETYDDELEVRIGMIQEYGSNFAMDICYDIEEHTINSWYGGDYRALVLTEGTQVGIVNYEDDEDEEDY
jgi:hypothetical protein